MCSTHAIPKSAFIAIEAALAEKDAVIAALQAELSQAQSQLSQAQSQLSHTKAQLDQSQARVIELENLVATLQARRQENSQNSNRPPSSDSPEQRKQRPKRPPSGRPRGAQKGHNGHRRQLLPPEQVTQRVELFATQCSRCHKRLRKSSDGEPMRHQVIELPELKVDVTEYQRHRVRCSCGQLNTAELPTGVAQSLCGPRLIAFISLQTGAFHQSRRQAQQLLCDALGIKISLGALSESEDRVSQALVPAVEQVQEHVLSQPVKHVDATRWQNGGLGRSLWVIATTMATWFSIAVDGSKEKLQELFGGRKRGILQSDRGSQFGFWALWRRQICWAHLSRKFVWYAEQKGVAGQIGKRLLMFTERIFAEWYQFRERKITREQLKQRIAVLGRLVETCLEKGAALGAKDPGKKKRNRKGNKKGKAQTKVPSISGSCKHILRHREALWTFASHPGVEPTNNHAEQQLRAFVLWRKKSFGSQSERGCRFAERIMTVVQTLRKQKRPVFAFLVDACQAAMGVGVMPSLLPVKN